MNRQTNGQTEFLPILQDLYRDAKNGLLEVEGMAARSSALQKSGKEILFRFGCISGCLGALMGSP